MAFLTAPPSVHPLQAPYGAAEPASRGDAQRLYRGVRAHSDALAAPLTDEDRSIQSMPDASPTKWHLAHTTWFFETMVLQAFAADYEAFNPAFATLFNSYYESLGPRHPRPQRGLLSRPSCAEITQYRAYVDECVEAFIAGADAATWAKAAPLLTLGCHHEQQHQELLLTDILHAFSLNPTFPVYAARSDRGATSQKISHWIACDGGLQVIGHDGTGFAFDNEGPAHDVYVAPFCIASHSVTNAEWLAFIDDGGYRRPELWLSDGWATVQQHGWSAPLYWIAERESWRRFTLGGVIALDDTAPVCHVSYYEADAYARWCGKRLPTEQEWETVARDCPNFLNSGVWQWTQSPYTPYPRFKAAVGAVGEYNGKFMVNQMVLRGGSCATPAGHIRATYRNFFHPHARWQFSGVRLAADI